MSEAAFLSPFTVGLSHMALPPLRRASRATSPQRGEEPKLEKHRDCGSSSSPFWGEVAPRSGDGEGQHHAQSLHHGRRSR